MVASAAGDWVSRLSVLLAIKMGKAKIFCGILAKAVLLAPNSFITWGEKEWAWIVIKEFWSSDCEPPILLWLGVLLGRACFCEPPSVGWVRKELWEARWELAPKFFCYWLTEGGTVDTEWYSYVSTWGGIRPSVVRILWTMCKEFKGSGWELAPKFFEHWGCRGRVACLRIHGKWNQTKRSSRCVFEKCLKILLRLVSESWDYCHRYIANLVVLLKLVKVCRFFEFIVV